MSIRPAHKAYVAKLVALLRSDRPLDDRPFPYSPLDIPLGDDILIRRSDRWGLSRWERNAIADIVEYFFRRRDGKKQGRPPHTMLEKWDDYARLLKYQRLV